MSSEIIKIHGLFFMIFLFLFLVQSVGATEWELKTVLKDGGHKVYVDNDYIYGIGVDAEEEHIRMIYIWDKNDMNLEAELLQPFLKSIHADNDYIYAVTNEVAKLVVWYRNNMSLKARLGYPPFFFRDIHVDDRYIYGAYGGDNVIRVWYKDNLTILKDLDSSAHTLYADEDYIYGASGDIYVWRKDDMTLLKVLNGAGLHDVYSDGDYIYGLNGDIFIIDKNDFSHIYTIETDNVHSMRIDDDHIYGTDGTIIYVWYKNNFTLADMINDDVYGENEIDWIEDINVDGNCLYVGVSGYENVNNEEEHENAIVVLCKKEDIHPRPKLKLTQVENLFGDAFVGANLQSSFTGQYIKALITAWISNDDFIKNVQSNFSSSFHLLPSKVVPMEGVEEGEYSRIVVGQSVEIVEQILQILIPYLRGKSLSILLQTRPEITWDYVMVGDLTGNDYAYKVNKKLPTVLDTLPDIWNLKTTIIISACPVDMLVIDPESNKVGALYENGEFSDIIDETNNSIYSGTENEPEFVAIIEPIEGEYEIEIYGNESGIYNLTIISVDNGSVFYEKNYTNISIERGETHRYEEPITDIEAPEAVMTYEYLYGEIIVDGVDNFDEDVDITYEEKCSKHLFDTCVWMERNYTLVDDAKNQLILTIGYNKIERSYGSLKFLMTYVRLLDAEYKTKYKCNNIDYKFNFINYNTNKKSDSLKGFSQNIYVKNRGFIRASYNIKRNETIIRSNFDDKPKKIVLGDLNFYKVKTDSETGMEIILA